MSYVRRLLHPKAAVLSGPNKSSGKAAFLNHVSILMDSAGNFSQMLKFTLTFLQFQEKYFNGVCFGLSFTCLSYYFLYLFLSLFPFLIATGDADLIVQLQC